MKPFVAKVTDYHEFDEIRKHLALAGINSDYMELDESDIGSKYSTYMAVFYLNGTRTPSKGELLALAEKIK